MVKPVKNDLGKYGVPIAKHRRTDTAKVVPKPGGGWTVRDATTGQTETLKAGGSNRADMLRAADAVILRHQEVIRKLAKR
jgi:hypothetical protein